MGRYTTNKGITWSDEDGGFEADDILKLAQAYQQNKLATAANTRADTALLMQQEQIAKAETLNNRIIRGDQLYNDMTRDMFTSGWNEEGVWDAEGIDVNSRVESYLEGMANQNMAGNRVKAQNDLQILNTKRLVEGGRQFQYKVKQWEEANKEKYGKWYWPGDDTFDEDRMAYIKSIGGERIFRQAWNLGGLEAGPAEGNAQAITGLTSEDFAPSDDWSTGAKVATGAAITTAGTVAYKKWGPDDIMESARNLFSKGKVDPAEAMRLMPHLKDTNAKGILEKIIKAQDGGDTKTATKLIERFKTKYPEIVMPQTTSQKILKQAKKILKGTGKIGKAVGLGIAGFTIAEKLASGLGDTVVGEKDSKTGQVAGIAGGTAGVYAVPAMVKQIGGKISEKGAKWAMQKVLEKGGPMLAARFAAKAGLSGITGAFSGGLGTALTIGFLATDLVLIAEILAEDE